MPEIGQEHAPATESLAPGAPFIEMSHISKRFAGAVALEDVSIELHAGEIHAVIGANGAGKSTLGKILAGVHTIDAGEIRISGQSVQFNSPADALGQGIAIMQQEIALAGKMSVIDNVFLGTEHGFGQFVSRKRQYAEYEELRSRTGFVLDPDAIVDDLRLGEQQQVSVLWALARHARAVVMDEPTASLDREDSHRLLETAKMLAASGIAVVFVSHFLDEVLAVSDRITVLANGHHVLTRVRAGMSENDLVEAMIGGSLDAAFPGLPPSPDDATPPIFETRALSVDSEISDISVQVRPGEVLGIYGLVGSGRSEFALAVAGATKGVRGEVRIEGSPVSISSPLGGIRAGITLLPESRKDQGLMLGRSVFDNTSLSALDEFTSKLGFVKDRALLEAVDDVLTPLALRGGNRLREEVGNFSGGNQQKVLLGKCLLTRPKLLILDEPTRGVDIGAKRAIYDVIVEIAAQGTAIILISSEEAEVMHLCHRIHVFRDGRVADEMTHDEADENRLLAAALGANDSGSKSERNGN